MEYMNGKYLGRTNVVMITFGDLDKLPYPNKFSTAISNCERVLECVIMITTVGLDNKINERLLTSMERSCMVIRRETEYYEAKATGLGGEDNYVGTGDEDTPSRRAALDLPHSEQTN